MIFINNKYTRIYEQIVAKAQARGNIESYTERHHIIPKSLGGDNSKDNLVDLTAREHFLCHWLLTKMVSREDHYQYMIKAFGCMMWVHRDNQERYKVSGRLYERVREEHHRLGLWSKAGKKGYRPKQSEETKEKIRQSRLGKPRSEETKRAISEGRKRTGAGVGERNSFYGKSHSEETRAKISVYRSGRKDSEETKQRKREAAKNRPPMSEETKQKIRDSWKKRKAEKGKARG